MAKGGAASTANVVIKLKVDGHANVATQLKALDAKLTGLEAKYNGIAGKFDNIAQAFERHAKSLERHNQLMLDNATGIELWNEQLRDHRQAHKDTRDSWGESNNALRELKTVLGDVRKELGDFDKDIKRTHNQTLVDFDKELHRKREDFEKLSKAMKDADRTVNGFERSANKAGKALGNKDNKFGEVLGRFFKPGIKLMKYAGMEFAAMTAIVGGLQGALWLGQMAMKAFNGALTGLGAAAGYALGAVSGLLAAQRELAVTKMAPLLGAVGGPYSAGSKLAGTIGNPQLAQFSKAVPMITQAAAEKGQGGGAGLSSMLQTLGDVAITAKDPNKALSNLASTFLEVQKSGKFSKESLSKLKEQFPAMASGIEEFKKQNKSTTFSVDEFFAAFKRGEIEALKPFVGTLDKVNNTLAGRFKTGVAAIKEQLTEMGMPLLDLFKKPLSNLQREIQIFLVKVGNPIRKAFERAFGGGAGESFTARLFDKLASLIIRSLGKVEGFVERIRTAIFKVRQFFDGLGDKLANSSRSWDGIFKNILKPLGSEVWKTITYAVEKFNQTMDKTSSYSDGVAGAIHEIFEVVRKLIDAFSQLKVVLAPVMSSFMQFIKVASGFLQLLGPVGPMMMAFGLTGKMMGGGKGIFKAGRGKGGKGAADQVQQSALAAYAFGPLSKTRKPGALGLGAQPFSMFGLNNRFRGMSPLVSDAVRLAAGLPPKGAENYMDAVMYRPDPSTAGAGMIARMKMKRAGDQQGLADAGVSRAAYRDEMRKYRAEKREARRLNRESSLESINKGLGIGGPDSALRKFRDKFSGEAGKEMAKMFGATVLPMIASYLGGMISGKNAKTSNVAQGFGGLLSGAGMGASMGGMMGTVIPGVGTALGAGIGAVAGGAMGLFKGIQSAGKERKRQKEERIQAAYEASFAGIGVNDFKGLKSALKNAEEQVLNAGKYEQIVSDIETAGVNISPDSDRTATAIQTFYDQVFGPINKILESDDSRDAYANLAKLTADQQKLLTGVTGSTDLQALMDAVNKNNLDALNEINPDKSLSDYLNTFNDLFEDGKLKIDKTLLAFDVGNYKKNPENFAKDINKNIDTLQTLVNTSGLLNEEQKTQTKQLLGQYRQVREIVSLNPALLESGDAWKDVQKGYLKSIDEQNTMVTVLEQNLKMLTQNFDVTAEEAAKLATSAGYNLTKSLLGVDEVMNLLGYSSDDLANRATAAGRILRTLMTPIENARAKQEFQDQFDAAGQALFDAGTKGIADFTSKSEAMKPAQDFIDLLYQKAVQEYEKTPGMSYDQFIGKTEKDIRMMIDTQKSLLAQSGVEDPANSPVILALEEVLRTTIGGAKNIGITEKMQYDPALAAAVLGQIKDVTASKLLTTPDIMDRVRRGEGGDIVKGLLTDVAANLEKAGIKLSATDQGMLYSMAFGELNKQMDPMSQNIAELTDAIKNIAVHIDGTIKFDQEGKIVTASINAMDARKQGMQGPTGDTASSRLQRTLARHAMFSSSVPGNQTITSSLRNFNLGSPSSDHATGAAYDLTGDNLGQYAQMVNSSGGFAEFHGSAGSRHLHVVPPQSGDTSSPMAGSSTASTVTNHYSIQVVAKDDATAREVAQIVMRELDARERSRRERT